MPALIHKKADGSERKLDFGAKPLVVGRLTESDISVRDAFISRVHCGFTFANNQYGLKDLGSTNGTYRNGSRVFECTLGSGDKIQLGNTTLVFELDTTTGDAILRQVAQMVAPAKPAATAAPISGPPKQDLKSVTIQVKLPGVKPTVMSPAAPPPPPRAG